MIMSSNQVTQILDDIIRVERALNAARSHLFVFMQAQSGQGPAKALDDVLEAENLLNGVCGSLEVA